MRRFLKNNNDFIEKIKLIVEPDIETVFMERFNNFKNGKYTMFYREKEKYIFSLHIAEYSIYKWQFRFYITICNEIDRETVRSQESFKSKWLDKDKIMEIVNKYFIVKDHFVMKI